MPLRERSLLRLLYYRGASHRELAGALGISRPALRRMLNRILARATDPLLAATVSAWDRLAPAERRLAYLHRVLGLALRDIARQGLVPGREIGGRPAGAARLTTMRRQMRAIDRKVTREGAHLLVREDDEEHADRAAGGPPTDQAPDSAG